MITQLPWSDILVNGWTRELVGRWEDAYGRKWQETRIGNNPLRHWVTISVERDTFDECEKATFALASRVTDQGCD